MKPAEKNNPPHRGIMGVIYIIPFADQRSALPGVGRGTIGDRGWNGKN